MKINAVGWIGAIGASDTADANKRAVQNNTKKITCIWAAKEARNEDEAIGRIGATGASAVTHRPHNSKSAEKANPNTDRLHRGRESLKWHQSVA